ncbi:Histidine kinase-like ATPase [Flammeovirgaceae bacterium 311]|nr:Histidine kinase-like ATPase [Flammeovirgaceae bacterium 311]
MKAIVSALFLIILFCQTGLVYPQDKDIKFEKITMEDGLSQSTVNCIIKDKKGFMWIGTSFGLNRYDGYSFKSFLKTPNDSASISSNFVSCLYEDRDSVLWVGTINGGVNKFDKNSETFEVLKVEIDEPGIHDILAIYEDPSGNLYFGTKGGIILLNKKTGKASILKSHAFQTRMKEANIVRDFLPYNERLYIATFAGIQRLDSTGRFEIITERHQEDSKIPKELYRTKNGEIWIATEMGLGRLDKNGDWNNVTYPFPELYDFFINDIEEDADQNLWVATTGKGLAIINKERNKVTFHRRSLSNPHSVNNDDLISIYRDESGIFWIGGYGGGINKYDRSKNKFQTYRNEYSDNITSLLEDKNGDIWFVNAYSGVSRYSPKTNQLYNFHNKDYFFYKLCEDNHGNIWATHPHLGLSRFSKEKQRFEFLIKIPVRYSILNGEDGNLYVGTFDGLKAIDPLTLKIEDIFHEEILGDIHSISKGDNGKILLGGSIGKLAEYDLVTNNISVYPLELSSAKFTEKIPAVLEDKSGKLWVPVSGNGLVLLDRKTKKGIKLYNEKDGLPNNEIVSLLEDNSGKIWMATLNGLAVLDPKTEKINTYTTQDGLVHNEFNIHAAFKNKDGRLFFGGMEGYNHFNPEDLEQNKVAPPVVLTDFQIFNNSVPVGYSKDSSHYYLNAEISRTKKIDLLHDQNVFSFEFAALNFSLPEKNTYAYKMEGFDKEWFYSGTNRTATYTNLNPGKYLFKVKAANNDGIWNEAGTAVELVIHPPAYKTWWAYFLYFLLGLFIIYLIWRYFTNREKMKNELYLKGLESRKLQELDEIKTRFYTNVSHEFRTPLTLILGPLETASSLSKKLGANEIKRNLDMVSRNAQRLLELINQLMDFSKLESGHMNLYLEELDIVPFLRTSTLSFSSLAVSKGISLRFVTTAQQLIASIDKDKFEKILNNLLSNALKFTREGGSVEVLVDFNEHEIILQVIDDGIGIPEDKVENIFDRFYQIDNASKTYEGTGIGLALLKELVAFHNGKIEVLSKEGKGTVFTILFPVEIKEFKKASSVQMLNFKEGGHLEIEKSTINKIASGEFAVEEINNFTKENKNGEKSKPIILIVEDNHEIRAYIRSAFGRELVVLEAENGKKGLLSAEKNIPDLVITDIMMPEMDGQELCRLLKENEKTSHIPVILLTAKASQESKLEGFETGADDYITKPFHLKELQVRVKNLLEQREKLRKRFSRTVLLQPKEIAITSTDEKFLSKCIATVEKHMSNPDFSVDEMGREIGMSRSQLHRKLKALIDQSTTEFIRNIRLKRASELIKNNFGNTSDVAYAVGFNSVSYFIKCFRQVYGKTPSDLDKV